MPLRDGFFSTATQTSCCNRIQRSNRVRLLVVSTHDFPDILLPLRGAFCTKISINFIRHVPNSYYDGIQMAHTESLETIQFLYSSRPCPDEIIGPDFYLIYNDDF